MTTLEQRFIKKVNKTENCWIWIGARDTFGYGAMTVNKKNVNSHRVSYELFNGSIPEGLFVRHTCHNPACVNPKHLIVGTHRDNMRDMADSKRGSNQHKGKTHCKANHEFTESNTYFRPSGGRRCRTCDKAAWRALPKPA